MVSKGRRLGYHDQHVTIRNKVLLWMISDIDHGSLANVILEPSIFTLHMTKKWGLWSGDLWH